MVLACCLIHAAAQGIACTPPGKGAPAGYFPGEDRAVLSWCVSDLEKDGRKKTLLILGEEGSTFGDSLVILDVDADGNFREIFQQSYRQLNPWKVQTADVDGDGLQEISLGVYKKTKFHPVMAKRPFLYEWRENMLAPKWLGSRLARPFEDYIFADLDGDGKDELIAVEYLEGGENILQAYTWKGFGFEGMACSIPFARIHSLQAGREDGAPLVRVGGEKGEFTAWLSVYLQGEQLRVSAETREENR